MADAGRKLSFAAWVWVLVAGLAAFELVAHRAILAAVPSERSWEEASLFVRSRFQPSDRIVASPGWVDPIVRHHLGDLPSPRNAAPPDLAGVERVWELGIRGATHREDAPAVEHEFGGVRVRMWPIDSRRLVHDFVEYLPTAHVAMRTEDGLRPCPWSRARPDPGGLERGPMMPAERFICDRSRPWLWVGATVLADLDLEPRRCIWQHPAGDHPIRTEFFDVPIGERLVVHAGIDYQVARRRNYAPVTLSVWIDGEQVGALVHHDGDGWSELRVDTSSRTRRRSTVAFETTTPKPSARLFCYSASIQAEKVDE